MNCLSRCASPRALARAVGSVGLAALVILVVSGAYLALAASAARAASPSPTPSPGTPVDAVDLGVPPVLGPVAEVVNSGPGSRDQVPDQAPPGDEAAIVFTGSAMAPLVCSSKPDTTAITITDATRITLANLTGAVATVDTGTDQELTVADGIGVSVRFRPGQYAVRMVPDCTMTSDVDAAVLTVTAADSQADPSPDGGADRTPMPVAPTQPEASGSGPGPTTVDPADSPSDDPSTFVGPGAAESPGGIAPSGARPATPTPRPSSTLAASGSGQNPPVGPPDIGVGPPRTRPAVSPSGVLALPAGPGPVIYDIMLIPLPDRDDPRDARLLAVIAVICVFGVTMAIIRAILTQRARRVVST